jgi:hypothetical protein
MPVCKVRNRGRKGLERRSGVIPVARRALDAMIVRYGDNGAHRIVRLLGKMNLPTTP